jgi:hypothetical protein
MKTTLNRCPHCWASLPASVGEVCLHCARPLDIGRRRSKRTKTPAEPVSVVASGGGETATEPTSHPYRSPWAEEDDTFTPPPGLASPAEPAVIAAPPEAPVVTPVAPDLEPEAVPPPWSPPGTDGSPAGPTRRWLIVGLVVALVASVAGVAGWKLTRPDGPSFPSAWDPRVTDLVDFVEREHDLRFRHPVHVDFLPEAEFRELVTGKESDLTAEDRQDIEAGAGMLRALGLVDSDVDLFKAVNQLTGEGTLAFYHLESKRIRVRGTELNIKMRGTLVHELTHALQDQVFDLQRDFTLEAQNETFPPVYEGDAERIQSAWVATLSEAELAQYGEDEAAEAEGIDVTGVPEAVSVFFSAPYQLGEPFIQLVVKAGGERAVDKVLESPPSSDAQLFDPFRYLFDDGPAIVDVPKLADGEQRTDDGPFGAFGLFMVLAQRLDAHQALAAVDAWGGDAYVSFQRGGRHCVRAAFTGEDRAGTARIGDALDAWVAAMPSGSASVVRDTDLIELNSCDPGSAATTPEPGRLSSALTLPIFRSYIGIGILEATDSKELARCSANYLVTSFSSAELEKIMSEGPSDLLFQRSVEAGKACAGSSDSGGLSGWSRRDRPPALRESSGKHSSIFRARVECWLNALPSNFAHGRSARRRV